MLSVRHIELVRALAEHRHFGRAANSLGVSQPSLSKALATLEEEIGALLFERLTMQPTDFGKVVLRHGSTALANFAEIDREIRLLKQMEIGELTVAMGPYPGAISGRRAGAVLSRQRPNLKIGLRTMNWPEALGAVEDGDADIAFTDLQEAKDKPVFVLKPVREQAMSFLCRADHPLTGRRQSLSLVDLLEYPWIGPTIPGPLGGTVPVADKPYGEFDRAHQRFRPRVVVETFSDMKELTTFSDGVMAALPFQVAEEIAAGRLALLPVTAPFLMLNYGFVTKLGRTPTPAMLAYMELVLEIEAKLPPWSDKQA
ncbi:MAG: LysR family transcriptional regulator [Bradyrhizobium sp.]|nr:LysR family transcriptional regulator [Bradyrhizobium sp.]